MTTDAAEKPKAPIIPEAELPVWRHLYELALQVKEFEPWSFIDDTHTFGVRHPVANQVGFVFIRGSEEFKPAVMLHLDPAVAQRYRAILEGQLPDTPYVTLEMPYLRMAFSPKAMLWTEDLETIERIGMTFDNELEWPHFQSFRPGYMPWTLERGEVEFFSCALEQLLSVGSRYKTEPGLVQRQTENEYLIRVPEPVDGSVVWKDTFQILPPAPPPSFRGELQPDMLAALVSLPQTEASMEVDIVPIPKPVAGKNGRPLIPYLLLLVDTAREAPAGHSLLTLRTTIEELYRRISVDVGNHLVRLGMRPAELRVRSPRMQEVLRDLALNANIDLQLVSEHPVLSRVYQQLMLPLYRQNGGSGQPRPP